jgi:hypothetical protein
MLRTGEPAQSQLETYPCQGYQPVQGQMQRPSKENPMRFFKKTFLPILPATIWIGLSEFVRNQVLLKSYWTGHYQGLGLVFPAQPVNGAIWGLWSLLFAIAIFIIGKKFPLIQTTLLSWFAGFVLMWVVIGNLGVLPHGLLYPAIPLSLLEAFVAAFIIRKLS